MLNNLFEVNIMVIRGFKCRLKVILAEREIPLGVFSKKIGVRPGTLSQIANSRSLPSFEVTYEILEELNLRIDEVWVKMNEDN